jgi:hypothetical protein
VFVYFYPLRVSFLCELVRVRCTETWLKSLTKVLATFCGGPENKFSGCSLSDLFLLRDTSNGQQLLAFEMAGWCHFINEYCDDIT